MLSPNFHGDSHQVPMNFPRKIAGGVCPSLRGHQGIRQMLEKQRLDRGFWGHNHDFHGQMWVNANSGLINHGLIRDVVPK